MYTYIIKHTRTYTSDDTNHNIHVHVSPSNGKKKLAAPYKRLNTKKNSASLSGRAHGEQTIARCCQKKRWRNGSARGTR